MNIVLNQYLKLTKINESVSETTADLDTCLDSDFIKKVFVARNQLGTERAIATSLWSDQGLSTAVV